ncbi:MAG: chorismate--pyruvate lyase family protein [Acidithiobacillus sp.]
MRSHLAPRRHGPQGLWPWLSLPASLTAALRRAYGSDPRWPRAELLASGRRRASRVEAEQLGLHRQSRIFWREVLLHGPDPLRPAIWARTSFAVSAIGRGLRPLTRHGSRPIGNTLFRHRRLRRGPVQIRCAPGYGPQRRWWRHSLLWRGSTRVLVIEHFLPDLPVWRGRGRN